MLLVVENDNGRTMDILVGETVRVSLPENATTGYRWAIERCDAECLDAISTEPRYTASAIGSGGEVEFTFQGKKVGDGEIVLRHWRHWEGDSSVTARFHVRLRVKPFPVKERG